MTVRGTAESSEAVRVLGKPEKGVSGSRVADVRNETVVMVRRESIASIAFVTGPAIFLPNTVTSYFLHESAHVLIVTSLHLLDCTPEL